MSEWPRRVLFQPYFFLAESWNGIDEHLLLLSRHLDRRRFELLVLVHETDGPQTRLLAEGGAMRALDAPYGPGAGFVTRVTALRRLYSQERIDLVHLHSPVAGGQAPAAVAARLAGVTATLATYHQIQPARLPAKSRLINYLTHAALIQRTWAVSHGIQRSLVSEAGLPARCLEVVHNGIDPPQDQETAGAPPAGLPPRAPSDVWLGYFGRLSPEKGLIVVLQAMAYLAPRCPTAQLLVVGDGPERAELQALAQRLAVSDRVHFLGFRRDARAIMTWVDVLVHAPIYEGFGLVVLEAMAAGLPVVVNDVPGGLSETVRHGETGLVVPAASPEGLAEALLRLAADPDERRRLGQNGTARYEQEFSAQRMVEKVAALYEAALAGRS